MIVFGEHFVSRSSNAAAIPESVSCCRRVSIAWVSTRIYRRQGYYTVTLRGQQTDIGFWETREIRFVTVVLCPGSRKKYSLCAANVLSFYKS